jgi:hypothetical protein
MKEARQNPFRANGIRYGAAYYAEYQLSDRVDEDLDLMGGRVGVVDMGAARRRVRP